MSLAAVFDQLGQTTMPAIAAAAFPDTLTVKAESAATLDTGGGRVKGTVTNAYTSVPCAYEPTSRSKQYQDKAGDQSVSSQEYMVTMPTHTAAGLRIDLDPTKHRLVVASRGNEPAKTFRIITVRDQMGVVFECICQREG